MGYVGLRKREEEGEAIEYNSPVRSRAIGRTEFEGVLDERVFLQLPSLICIPIYDNVPSTSCLYYYFFVSEKLSYIEFY